jgi:hypothetical protein
VSVLEVEVSRRNFLKMLAVGAVSTTLGFSPSQTQALAVRGAKYKGAVIRNGFHNGPGYVAAPFWTPDNVPRFASLDARWAGAFASRFGFWVDREDLDGDVITPVLPVRDGMFYRGPGEHTSHFGTFPLEPNAKYWVGVAFLDMGAELVHLRELEIVPLWGDVLYD